MLLALVSASASATSLNLRHEFMPDRNGDEHRDRILVSHRFANQIGFSVEAKWGTKATNNKNGGESFLSDGVSSNGHEVGVSYIYKVTNEFSLNPAFLLDAGDNSTVYKFDLRGSYKLTDKWGTALRYRHGYNNGYNTKKDGHTTYEQLNLTSDYKFDWGKLGIDFEYKDLHDGGRGGYKNHGYDALVNFTGEYSKLESGIIPFVEFAMMSNDSDSKSANAKEEFAPRYRFGVKYNF